jgi:hypothetical protein
LLSGIFIPFSAFAVKSLCGNARRPVGWRRHLRLSGSAGKADKHFVTGGTFDPVVKSGEIIHLQAVEDAPWVARVFDPSPRPDF